MKTFFGKYRGTVVANVDPLRLARVQVSCPAVLGDGRMSWALPCVPYAGPGVGLVAVPPVGAAIWVEFEAGDPDSPIWTGCFWSTGQLPRSAGLPTAKVFRTDGVEVVADDLPGTGGLTIEVSPPVVPTALRFSLSAGGIELTAGTSSVALTPASVSVNNGALEVT
ncbi:MULTISPECIES: phage baseplate assembly protein V [unclassified Amycolatopsis]|uniref:phage baseplate assembly protein V n=1 Tax=unclassified Amycolatopsis TaxID=2618356 RepID=UPI002E2291A9|nr:MULTISPECIES: phage baseplate assembly protein V [unclassified Amycolatopsis]